MKRFLRVQFIISKNILVEFARIPHLHMVTNFLNYFNYACVHRIRRPRAVLAIFKLLLT